MEADDSADSDCELVIDEGISIVRNGSGDDKQPKSKQTTDMPKKVATVTHNWGIFHPLAIGSAVMKEELFQEDTNTCNICNETFRYNVGLICHLEMDHVDVKKTKTGKTSSSSSSSSSTTRKKSKTIKKTCNVKLAKTKLTHSVADDDESLIKIKKNEECVKSDTAISEARPTLISKTSCEVCKKSFTHRGKLIKHMEMSNSKFHCVYCKLKFGWESKYKKHLFRIHKLNAAVICKLCSSVFSNMDDLESHSNKCEKTFQVLVKSEPADVIVDD